MFDIKSKITKDIKNSKSTYFAEGLYVANRNMHFLDDEKFMSAVNSIADCNEEHAAMWRTHIFCWAFRRGLVVPGDLVELGVHRGYRSSVAAHYTDFEKQDKNLWLYDTWSGVPVDQENPGYVAPDKFKSAEPYQKAQERFAKYSNVHLIPGRVPEILEVTSPKQISFLHIDVNSAIAEIGALEVVFDRVSPGGIVLLDDFGLMSFKENCNQSLDWLNSRGYSPVELPTYQGIIIK
jgi:hypothetical protein